MRADELRAETTAGWPRGDGEDRIARGRRAVPAGGCEAASRRKDDGIQPARWGARGVSRRYRPSRSVVILEHKYKAGGQDGRPRFRLRQRSANLIRAFNQLLASVQNLHGKKQVRAGTERVDLAVTQDHDELRVTHRRDESVNPTIDVDGGTNKNFGHKSLHLSEEIQSPLQATKCSLYRGPPGEGGKPRGPHPREGPRGLAPVASGGVTKRRPTRREGMQPHAVRREARAERTKCLVFCAESWPERGHVL